MSTTLAINGTITLTDNVSGTIALNKLFSGLISTGSAYMELGAGSVGTTPTAQTLPVSPVQFVYLKNTHSVQTLTVAWTPTGGASNTVVLLEPGSAIMLCETAVGGGITALSLTGSLAATTYESILGG
jgi:hypothetical protein